MTTPGGQANPPGWYPDPAGQPLLRWWDGIAWGEQTQAQAGQAPGAAPQPTFGQPAFGQPAPGQPAFGQPAQYPAWTGGPTYVPPQSASNSLSIAGIICGALALLILPIILGPAGLILGGIAKSRGEPRANIALIVAGVGMVGGFIIGYIFASSMLT